MTAKTSISLTDDQDTYTLSLVQRGLEMLRHESERRDAELQSLRSLIDQRRAGAFVDIDAGEAETRAIMTRKRRKSATR